MPIRFSPARRLPQRRIPAGFRLNAANDNRRASRIEATPPELREALAHFAQFGLSAARVAKERALDASARGEITETMRWSRICSALDGRLGKQVAERLMRQGIANSHTTNCDCE